MRWVFGILALSMVAFGQDSVIRVDTALQELIVTARDNSGRLVQGLTAEDFQIEWDGAPQAIAHFNPDTGTPVSVGLLIDTSRSMQIFTDVVKEAGAMRIFLNATAKEGDEFSLMTFSDSLKIRQPFTGDKTKIDLGLRALYPTDLTPSHVSTVQPLKLFEAVRRALTEMKRQNLRQRGLVIATEAYDENDLREVLQEVRSSEIPIFILGFRGFYGRVTGVRAGTMLTAQIGERMQYLRGETAEDILARIADESGGRSEMFILNENDPVDRVIAFADEVATELRGQYRLGFYLKDTGGNAEHVVRVKSITPGYSVRFHRLLPNK